MISMLVGRCHVSESYVEVLRYCVSRMRKGAWAESTREVRREFVGDVMREHRANRACYADVMWHRAWGATSVLGSAVRPPLGGAK